MVLRWGAELRVLRAETRERGPPSVQAEIGLSGVHASAEQTKVATIFGILEYNPAEHQYNLTEHQYNLAEHQYIPAEHQIKFLHRFLSTKIEGFQ